MFSLTPAILWKLFAVVLILVAVIDLLTMSETRRVRMYRRQGLSQRAISERLGISTYKVHKALATI